MQYYGRSIQVHNTLRIAVCLVKTNNNNKYFKQCKYKLFIPLISVIRDNIIRISIIMLSWNTSFYGDNIYHIYLRFTLKLLFIILLATQQYRYCTRFGQQWHGTLKTITMDNEKVAYI